ncbi:uncharacterized protein LOC21398933 [Morus notabilis]|nr:uncharacterized protein LOC21398933 [Morus notabilis]
MKLVYLLCFVILSMATRSDSRPQKKVAATTTVYDALKQHGLPMGLLPKGVKDFEIDENGNFQVHLDKACNAKFESELHYDRNVSGTLSYGQIGALSGISAQELFLWFPVKGIRVDIPSSGLIYFDVGVVFKQFSLSLFESPPECVAVRTLDRNDFSDSKRESGKLRYQRDQETFGRDVV